MNTTNQLNQTETPQTSLSRIIIRNENEKQQKKKQIKNEKYEKESKEKINKISQSQKVKNLPRIQFEDGREEIQDEGVTLGDLLRYYPNYYLIEKVNSNEEISHRSAAYVLRNGVTYSFRKDERAVDFGEEFALLNNKMENLGEENMRLQSQITELIMITQQLRRDQLYFKQNVNTKTCIACYSSLKYKPSKRCKLCEETYCVDCTTLMSFPVGFHKSKNAPFVKPKRCCRLCLTNLFYMRNHPPLDLILRFHQPIKVIKEKIISKKSKMMQASFILHKPPPNHPLSLPSSPSSNLIPHSESELDAFPSSYFLEHSFYTAGDSKIAIPLKFLDPLCRLTFWFSGMQEGQKFDRRLIDRATGTKYTSSNQANRFYFVDVPAEYPSLTSLSSSTKFTPLVTSSKRIFYSMKVLTFFPSKGVGPFPAVVFYHGGGFCVGRPTDQIYENACSSLSDESSSVVVSVDYRLAPEYKYPTQVEDGYAALLWVYEHAPSLNIDRDKLIVCGDSAGGTIAAVVAMMARDRNGPKLTHQILIYPCLTYPIDDSIPSQRKYFNGPILTRKILKWFLLQLFDINGEITDLKEVMNNIYASPLHPNASADGLPPTAIINAMHDPLCDHGLLYAKKLIESNVPVTRTVYRKSTHGFFGAFGGESTESMKEIESVIRVAFGLDVVDTRALDQLYKKKILE